MNVCFASDNNYCNILIVAMYSLLKNYKGDNLNIYILESNISEKNKKIMFDLTNKYNCNLKFIDITSNIQILKKYKVNELRVSLLSYSRLFLPDLLPLDVKKITYLDCDICVVDDLSTMDDINMNGKAIGMVIDTMLGWHNQIIDLPKTQKYYNAGVVMFDLDKCREIDFTNRVLEHIMYVRNYYPCHDQDLLNVCFADEIFTLPLEYNMLNYTLMWSADNITNYLRLSKDRYYTNDEVNNALENQKVLHLVNGGFIGRPWENGNIHPAKIKWKQYLFESPIKNSFVFSELRLSPYQKMQRIILSILGKNLYCKTFNLWHLRYEHKNLKELKKEK